jgi:hypothetical protein
MDLSDIYGIFHTTVVEWTLFPVVDHILRQKASLDKWKKTEMIYFILSDHNGIKLEINSQRNYRKYTNTMKLNSVVFEWSLVIKEIRNTKSSRIKWELKSKTPKLVLKMV